jgi:hypothetical protein
LTSNDAHCGACGTSCGSTASTPRCHSGSCVQCLNSSDCGSGKICSNYHCVCSTGTDCGASGCIDTTANDNSCGGCGAAYACGSGRHCTGSQCRCNNTDSSCGTGTTCSSCAGTATPRCASGTCVQCTQNSDCPSPKTCSGGQCVCTTSTYYRDFDGDGYGDPNKPEQLCAGTPGYVSNNDDCDDSANGASIKPGVAVCTSDRQNKQSCQAGGHGVWIPGTCPYGCAGAGNCRPEVDGTMGVAGYVSCASVKSCPTTYGCSMWADTCGTADSPGSVLCDGPSDCPGGYCCVNPYGVYAKCSTTPCQGPYYPACDPDYPPASCSCLMAVDQFPIFTCQSL